MASGKAKDGGKAAGAPLVARAGDAALPPPARRRRRRGGRGWLLLLVLLLLAGGGGAAWWWGWGQEAARGPQYLTAAVTRGAIEDSTMASGTLQPLDYVDVGAQISGQLDALHVEVGDEVAKGDLLAEIDPTLFLARVDATRAQLENLRAQLADREAQLVLARQQEERQRRLMASNATSEDALQSAEAALKSARAQVAALKAQIQNTESELAGDETNLSYTNIFAPMSGTVVSQEAQEGQTLNANQSTPVILRIADLSTMTVTAQVSEADIGDLTTGMPAYFTTLGRPDRRWEGTLRKIMPTPEVVNNVVLYNALFDVPNPSGELMTQMTAQVFFVTARAENALLIPVSALRPLGGPTSGEPEAPPAPEATRGAALAQESAEGEPVGARYAVQVLGPGGEPQRRVVTVGIMNRVQAQVLEGLDEGDRVVVGRQAADAEEGRPRFGPRLG